MAHNFIIVTTPSIEGFMIKGYKGVVTFNQVVGVNVISDAIASLSDFFGGMSGEYRSKMNGLKDSALKNIELEAKKKGANAVIGFNMNISEVSGKGKQMFMITAVGTAVEVENESNNNTVDISKTSSNQSISGDYLKVQLQAMLGINAMTTDDPVSDEAKNAILAICSEKWIETLYNHFLSLKKKYFLGCWDNVDANGSFIYEYFNRLPVQVSAPFLYSHLLSDDQTGVAHLIVESKVLSYSELDKIKEKIDLEILLRLLNIELDNYSTSDIPYMDSISSLFHQLPVIRVMKEVKTGMFGKLVNRCVCSCGCQFEEEPKFCPSCHRNRNGLKEYQEEVVSKLDGTIGILKGLNS